MWLKTIVFKLQFDRFITSLHRNGFIDEDRQWDQKVFSTTIIYQFYDIKLQRLEKVLWYHLKTSRKFSTYNYRCHHYQDNCQQEAALAAAWLVWQTRSLWLIDQKDSDGNVKHLASYCGCCNRNRKHLNQFVPKITQKKIQCLSGMKLSNEREKEGPKPIQGNFPGFNINS